jgi:regulatory protein
LCDGLIKKKRHGFTGFVFSEIRGFFVLFLSMDTELHKMLLKKAGALLARRSYSRGELRDKLARFAGGFPVEPVLDRLEQLNLLNDTDYAYNFALCRIRQRGWAPAKVQNSLLRRKIEPAVIENALEKAKRESRGESNLAHFVQKYCRKRGLPADSREIRKLVFFLHQRGYDEDNILDTLRQMLPHAVWQRFETGE